VERRWNELQRKRDLRLGPDMGDSPRNPGHRAESSVYHRAPIRLDRVSPERQPVRTTEFMSSGSQDSVLQGRPGRSKLPAGHQNVACYCLSGAAAETNSISTF
jgi:hypothetical protein